MMRDGLRAILLRAGHDVVGAVCSGREAVAFVKQFEPDLVVMDVSMPDLNGIEATRQVRTARPLAKVVALSMHADKRYVTSMLDAGASGYVLKSAASEELLQAIAAIMQGRIYISASLGLAAEGTPGASLPAKQLSPREREVLQLIAEGKSSKEVACRLGIAVPTVDTHRRQLMDKLNLRTVAELTKYAIREGLTPLE
jgi:DNA-binding NarL/FixJ family response regulator